MGARSPYQHSVDHTDTDAGSVDKVEINVCHLSQGQGRNEERDGQNQKNIDYVKPRDHVLDRLSKSHFQVLKGLRGMS